MGSIGMDHVISEPGYKQTILHRNSFVKFRLKKFGSHNMIVLYPNLFSNEVYYKETALNVVSLK